MNELKKIHKKNYGVEPAVSVSVPGVVNILGEYCDFNCGSVVSMTISKDVQVSVSKRNDSSLFFYDCKKNAKKKSTLTNLKYKEGQLHSNYIRGVISELLLIGLKLPGMDFSLKINFIEVAGLGSATAVALASVIAIKELTNIDITEAQMIQVAHRALTRFMGMNKTLTDFYCAYYSKNTIQYFDLKTLEYEEFEFDIKGYEILIINSNVELSDDNKTISALKNAFDICENKLRQLKNGRSLGDYRLEDLDLLIGKVPEVLRRKTSYFFMEKLLINKLRNYFIEQDMVGVGKYIKRSHESIRDVLEASCPEVDWLVNRALESEDILGAKHIGSVQGGSVFILGREGCREDIEEKLEEYEKIFGFIAEVFKVETSTIKIEKK